MTPLTTHIYINEQGELVIRQEDMYVRFSPKDAKAIAELIIETAEEFNNLKKRQF